MKNNDLSDAGLGDRDGSGAGAGLPVRAGRSSIAYPASLSFGLVQAAGHVAMTGASGSRHRRLASHHYKLTADVRYSDFDPAIAGPVALARTGPVRRLEVVLPRPADRQRVWLRLELDPGVISERRAGVRLVLLPPERRRIGDDPAVPGRPRRHAPRPVARRAAGGLGRSACPTRSSTSPAGRPR